MDLTAATLITDEETQSLVAMAQSGDADALDRLVNANLRLVRSIAARFIYNHTGADSDDLFQVGSIGLLKAIEKFDFSFGVCFSTYAVPTIMGEIRRYLRDYAPINQSRSLKERSIQVRQMQDDLAKKNGHEPSIRELAAALSMDNKEVVAAIEAAKPLISIQEGFTNNEGEQNSAENRIGYLVSGGEYGEEKMIEEINIRESLDSLSPRLSYIVKARYFEDKTQAEIAAILGISQVHVSRLEKQAFNELRKLLT
jgi:RNA polymerase sporulation-specific sigma factor